MESAAAREVARKERERLKQMDKIRREQLERYRETANADAAAGDVSIPGVGGLAMSGREQGGEGSSGRGQEADGLLCRTRVGAPPLRTPTPVLLQAARGKRRLNFLLKQAEVFQHFAPMSAEKAKKKRGRHGGATEEQVRLLPPALQPCLGALGGAALRVGEAPGRAAHRGGTQHAVLPSSAVPTRAGRRHPRLTQSGPQRVSQRTGDANCPPPPPPPPY